MLGFFNRLIPLVFALLFSYHVFYILVSLFKKDTGTNINPVLHNIAVLICARNEEYVIADLLKSLDDQTYPKECFEVFVIADNCTDHTADIAKANGAIVYERQNRKLIGKGYALEELLSHIQEDYPEFFDAFVVFDADNIVKEDYLEQMNISYCQGNKIIAGYINSKNYDSNWISAGYSLFLLNKNRFLNNARNLLGLSCAINGTGFLFDKEVVVSGWPYHTLTEDIELSVDQACRRNRIAYCSRAILYDEQPTVFTQSCQQRLRWAKGYIQVIRKYAGKLFAGILKGSFSCYDMLNTILSAYALSATSLILNTILLFNILISRESILSFITSIGLGIAKAYMCMYFLGILTTITEWKRINASTFDRIKYTFTYPIFIATYVPIAFYALFAKVSWVPIRHTIRVGHKQKVFIRN